MAVTVRTFRSQAAQAAEEERQDLLDSLSDTRVRIQQAYGSFNAVSDPDLIESFVYEINSLQKRYAYLLRRVKALDGAPAGQEGSGMSDLLPALTPVLGSAAVLFALLVLRRPLGALLRLAARSGVGFCFLAVLGRLGLLPGLGATLLNALVLGVLGVPGFGLLLMLRWLLLT